MTTPNGTITHRAPRWPAWVADTFTDEGLRLLGMAHEWLRSTPQLERANRVSAEDLATCAVVLVVVAGRADLLRRIP